MSEQNNTGERKLDPEAHYRVVLNRPVPVPFAAVPRHFLPRTDNVMKGKVVSELPAVAIVSIEPVELLAEG